MAEGRALLNMIETKIPYRLDRLPFSRWHWRITIFLGISWILDGLEVTIVSTLGPVLTSPETVNFSTTEIGIAGSSYNAGSIIGCILFGFLADRYGRKKLFLITPSVYLISAFMTGFTPNIYYFCFCRFMTGMGIGGEFSAINSAISEFTPAKQRGRVDLQVNSCWWVGSILGSLLSIPFLDTNLFGINTGWRLSFILGSLLGIITIISRIYIPDSPRWLVVHRQEQKAEEIVKKIEEIVEKQIKTKLEEPENSLKIYPYKGTTLSIITKTLFYKYWKRTILSLILIIAQSFFYNAVFFSYSFILTKFYNVDGQYIGLYIMPFAVANLLGAFILGRLFDTIGRIPMIALTYALSGILLIVTGLLFMLNLLNDITQTVCWTIVFFFASAGSSASFVTIGEIFPLEIRALAIAFFNSLGTAGGGFVAPIIFGALIQSGEAKNIFYGYAVGGGLMLIGAITELILGVKAERQSLEEVATPISAALLDSQSDLSDSVL